jgi:pimeloyl-ACP methyl ester carboxylesterase
MRVSLRIRSVILSTALSLLGSAAALAEVVKEDLFVPTILSAAPNAGEVMAIHVRRKIDPSARAVDPTNRVVLLIHGGTVPSPAAYDLEFQDYSWMDRLAREGFDVWAMSFAGFGWSARPGLDDPCNVNPEHQKVLSGRPLAAACKANIPRQFNTIVGQWKEIDSVVDHIRKATGSPKISLVGWSAGGPRAGGYASQNPDKVNRLFLFAPSPPNPNLKLTDTVAEGYTTNLQTRDDLFNGRWKKEIGCGAEQADQAVQEPLWSAIMAQDRIGASWGPEEGVMRSPTLTAFGWTPEMAQKLKAPMLLIVGEFDNPTGRKLTYDLAGSPSKVLVNVDCASHFMVWEKQRKVLQDTSVEWLRDGAYQGSSSGVFRADKTGKVMASQ